MKKISSYFISALIFLTVCGLAPVKSWGDPIETSKRIDISNWPNSDHIFFGTLLYVSENQSDVRVTRRSEIYLSGANNDNRESRFKDDKNVVKDSDRKRNQVRIKRRSRHDYYHGYSAYKRGYRDGYRDGYCDNIRKDRYDGRRGHGYSYTYPQPYRRFRGY